MFHHVVSAESLKRTPALALFFLALSLGGAMPVVAQENPPKEARNASATTPVELLVENHNFMTVHVYAIQAGFVRSLGVVDGMGTQKLALPVSMTNGGGELRLLAHPIGARVSYLTDPIILGSSKEVELEVENQIQFSSFLVR